MKKVLPLLLFVLLAFAGCQRGPAVYQVSKNPKEMVANAEKFAKQTTDRSASYTAEEWQVAVEQFISMSKDFVDKKRYMRQEDIDRVDAARLVFIKAVGENGSDELAVQIKEAYKMINN